MPRYIAPLINIYACHVVFVFDCFTNFQVASGGNGATTVSATMFFAHKVLSRNITSYSSYLSWFYLIAMCS